MFGPLRHCVAGLAAILALGTYSQSTLAQGNLIGRPPVTDRDPSRCRSAAEMKVIQAEISRWNDAEKISNDKMARLNRVRAADNRNYQLLLRSFGSNASGVERAKVDAAKSVVEKDDLEIEDLRGLLQTIASELRSLRALKACPPSAPEAGLPPEPAKLYSVGTRVKPSPSSALSTSWSGFYVGGGLGANWTNGSWTTRDVRSLGTSDLVFDAVKDFKAENLAEDVYFGHLWQGTPEWLAGLEAEFVYFNAYMDPGIPGTGGLPGNKASDSVSVRAKWSASLRGRLGYLVTPSTQVYVTGGPAWLRMDATINCTGPGVCGTNGIPPFSQTNSTTKVGWTLGAGIEGKLWGNWRGRAEYRYTNYGTFSTSFGTPAQLALSADLKVNTNTVMMGLAYALGEW